jgi:hypothetical protein
MRRRRTDPRAQRRTVCRCAVRRSAAEHNPVSTASVTWNQVWNFAHIMVLDRSNECSSGGKHLAGIRILEQTRDMHGRAAKPVGSQQLCVIIFAGTSQCARRPCAVHNPAAYMGRSLS